MENNKLLIGVQFAWEKPGSQHNAKKEREYSHIQIELYVLRDNTLWQLFEGVKYGLRKATKTNNAESREIYLKCLEVFEQCFVKAGDGKPDIPVYDNITLTYFKQPEDFVNSGKKRFTFNPTCLNMPLYKLGFIDSTRIIFDATGTYEPKGKYDTDALVEAFDPSRKQRIAFPEYNISTRQLYRFDDSAVRIIPPTDPPKKPNTSLVEMLKPVVLSLGVMLIARLVVGSMNLVSGLAAVALSIGMGLVSMARVVDSQKKQEKNYAEALDNWRNRYGEYINGVIADITKRQNADVEKLQALYPDPYQLITEPDPKVSLGEQGTQSVYCLNNDLFSRSPEDEDFLTFRIGLSDDVPSKFKVEGEMKDTVFSEAFFGQVQINGHKELRMYLRDEQTPSGMQLRNLCQLPFYLNQRFAKLRKAPLLYSLKNKGALGIVDLGVQEHFSRARYFISRMIFELCYYHSPEDLQFVVFFDKQTQWEAVETFINRYKFLPHFRGLFGDKSQFVFDEADAHATMSNLLSIMQQRAAGDVKQPHIVMIVFEEHGLKEHAFAEFLPKVPADGGEFVNKLGLSFVFATKFKEYLPHYCDDVVHFNGKNMTLTPRSDSAKVQRFTYNRLDGVSNIYDFMADYEHRSVRAFRFLSSVYYAKIAQNGKVPSTVTMFDVLEGAEQDLVGAISKNWDRSDPDGYVPVTKSLSVPIGMTETGMAYLDLHEKKDGPHMLVAGTTGSGKSETIISYLLALCMKYRPDELNLMLIDMKGGGFTKRLGNLPHVVGAITDVEGDENGTGAEYMLRRFLEAMDYEIKRRKLKLNALKVDSVDDYIKACADIEAHITRKKIPVEEQALVRETAKNYPLSHLILVVDEFTELKRFTSENSEIDYMGEITTLARIGRSLGFHIILISQNIEGAITDDIRVNSKSRMCLRVATRQASKEMLGSEVAASPHMPGNGRAYLQVGTGERLDYFQSAFSGADSAVSIPVEFTLASKRGSYRVFYRSDEDNEAMKEEKKRQQKAGTNHTQLEVIVDAISEAEKKLGAYKKHQIFSAPLPTCIALGSDDTVIPITIRKRVD